MIQDLKVFSVKQLVFIFKLHKIALRQIKVTKLTITTPEQDFIYLLDNFINEFSETTNIYYMPFKNLFLGVVLIFHYLNLQFVRHFSQNSLQTQTT